MRTCAYYPKYNQQSNLQSSASLKCALLLPDAFSATLYSSNWPVKLQLNATIKWYKKAPPWINLENPPTEQVYWKNPYEKKDPVGFESIQEFGK